MWRVLLRGRGPSALTPLVSLPSASSGGSESGLDVDDRGLDGGLSSSALEAGGLSRPRPLVDWMFVCVLRLASRCLVGDRAAEFRTRSQNCSYGRITRLYELRSWVARPGTPVYPSSRPRSAHFLSRVTYIGTVASTTVAIAQCSSAVGQIILTAFGKPYRFIATESMHFLPQRPEIQRFVIDGGNGDARVALLLVEPVELLQKIHLGTRRRLDRVEPLQTGLEAKSLRAEEVRELRGQTPPAPDLDEEGRSAPRCLSQRAYSSPAVAQS